jgi:hypothetical protein
MDLEEINKAIEEKKKVIEELESILLDLENDLNKIYEIEEEAKKCNQNF